MPKLLSVVVVVVVVAALSAWQAGSLTAARVTPLFDLASPDRSPFPSDRWTVPDARQVTRRRVNLPMPADCAAEASECEDVAMLNQLDGFNLEARIAVPFTGAIDPSSATSRSVFLVRVDSARGARPEIIGINHVVWDPDAFELSFRPDRSLEEHTRYALVVTTGVRDADGRPIGAAPRPGADSGYQRDLRDAEPIVRRALVDDRAGGIAVLSVFTTQTFSHVISRVRDVIRSAPAPAVDFRTASGGQRAVFRAAEIETLTNDVQGAADGPLTSVSFAQALTNMRVIPGAVGTLAFGTFRALDFTVRPSGHVPPIPTRTGTLAATGSVDVAFDLWLPSGPRPARGWPVAIFAHGSGAGKNAGMGSAAVLTSHGMAVLSINAMGHGGGPRTTMTVGLAGGRSVTIAAPGLGYDADGDGSIETWEPPRAARPHTLMSTTGTLVQTIAQYLQLVRAIQGGIDVDGDGGADLDPSRIYYYGQSLGSWFGMFAFACEPAIRAAVFVVPAGALTYNTLLSPAFRPAFGQRLSARVPSLLNPAEGLTAVDGVEVAGPRFNENLPLRDQPPLVNRVAGARAIQRLADRTVWAAQITSTVAIAPMLRRTPLPGSPLRPFIVQMARSDPASTNPTASDMIRSGDFADRVVLYRHDLNFANAGVPANSHLFMTAVGAPPAFSRIARGAQEQIATFFESDGRSIAHPEPAEFWEVPIRALPDDLFFMPRPR